MVGWRKAAQVLIIQVCWRATIFCEFMLVIRKGKRDPSARVIVSNHRSMNDPFIHSIYHDATYLCRKDLVHSFSIGAMLTSTRSLKVDKMKSNKHLLEEMKRVAQYKNLCVYVEGTTTANHTMIRPRPGAFILGERIQPIVLNYKSLFPTSWLCEPVMQHVFNLAINLCSCCIVEYLPVIENESSDACGKRIADALGVEYLPYNNMDYWWFNNKTDDQSKCTPEYLRDFGWMG